MKTAAGSLPSADGARAVGKSGDFWAGLRARPAGTWDVARARTAATARRPLVRVTRSCSDFHECGIEWLRSRGLRSGRRGATARLARKVVQTRLRYIDCKGIR